MSSWGQKRALVINITKIIVMKPRRLTRRMLLRTSIASAFFIVLLFSLVYFTVLVINGNKKRDTSRLSQQSLRAFQNFKNDFNMDEKLMEQILARIEKSEADSTTSNANKIWDPTSLRIPDKSSPQCRDNIVLLILIISAPQNAQQRKSIRKTWCSVTRDVQCLFLMGTTDNHALQTKVGAESEEHGDILVGSYLDTYRNLTLKVIHGLLWTHTSCSNYQYLLKTDDDCFVNAFLIVQFLTTHNTRTKNLYVGNIYSTGKKNFVIRDSNSKWAVEFQEYAKEKYPPYASGEGYILSRDLVGRVLEFSSERLKPFPNEDAYIGVVMKDLNVEPIHSHRFTLANARWSVCNFMYLMVIHDVSPAKQKELFLISQKALKDCQNLRKVTKW